MSIETKRMRCVNNIDYEDCLTKGGIYDVEMENLGNGESMKKLNDDNGDFLQTMLGRFEEV
ncbi:hypothetical protein [Fictibacillus sp. NRS-1165]|uniref:hypothetical protein n=1 Tax=Fictibacillus sp. NRS-1165 TaxID=3144463 RepID=UPI003D23D9D9